MILCVLANILGLDKNTENKKYFFNNTEMKNNSKKKFVEIIIDNKLNFKSHVKNSFKEASQKNLSFVAFDKLLG